MKVCRYWVRAGTGLTLGFVPVAVEAQTLGGGSVTEVSYVRVGLSLLLCFGVAVAAAFALRHRIRSGGGLLSIGDDKRRLTVIERLNLGGQGHLLLVVVDDRELLLAVTGQGATLLLDRPVSAANEA
jgi:flagellar biogenesis protein FliO